jgi:hypothetical protein
MVIVKVGRFPVNSVGEAETLLSKANKGDAADLTLLVTTQEAGRYLRSEQVIELRAR